MRILLIGIMLAAACSLADEAKQELVLKEAGSAFVGFGVPGNGPGVPRGELLFLPPGEGDFTILDVSDRRSPKVAGYIVSPHFSYSPVFFKNLAYYHNSRGGTFAADVSEPASKDEVNGHVFYLQKRLSFDRGTLGTIRQVDESAGVMATVADARMIFLDLSDPAAPKKTGEVSLPRSDLNELIRQGSVFFPAPGKAVFQSDNRLKENRLYTVDFSTPAKPALTELLRVDTEQTLPPNPGHQAGEPSLALDAAVSAPGLDDEPDAPLFDQVSLVAASEDMLCLLFAGEGGKDPREAWIYSYDFTGAAPEKFASLSVPARCGTRLIFEFHAGFLYLLDGKGGPGQYSITYDDSGNMASRWFVYELKPGVLQPRHSFTEKVPSAYGYLTIADGHAYVNDYNYGTRIFDLSDPGAPEPVGAAPTAGEGSGVYVDMARKIAFLWVTFGGTIYSIDVSDPAAPKILGSFHDGAWVRYSNPSRADFISGKDSIVYVGKSRLQILDASDPANMTHVGFLLESDKDRMFRLHVEGDTLYALTDLRLAVFDVKNPASPSLAGLSALPSGFKPLGMAVRKGLVYAIGEGSRLVIMDARDPSGPAVKAELDLSGFSPDDPNLLAHIAVSGAGFGYVTSRETRGNTRLLVLDLRNPSAPRTIGWVESKSGGFWAWACFNTNMEIDESRNLLFVCKYMQVECFDISDPEHPRFLAKKHLVARGHDDWQWTIGPAHDGRIYVPSLRALHILEYGEE